ncbi:unnamed protein product, partial [Ectocarpus sp. 8 AP-2014]
KAERVPLEQPVRRSCCGHVEPISTLFSVEIRCVTLGTLGELAEAGLLSSSETLALQAVGVAVKHRATRFAPEPARTLALHLFDCFHEAKVAPAPCSCHSSPRFRDPVVRRARRSFRGEEQRWSAG